MFSQLGDKLQDIFKDLRGHGTISEANINDALRQVRLALLEADVDVQVAKQFIARVKEKALGEEVLRSVTPGQQIVKIFHEELTTLLGGDAAPLNLEKPARILMVGLNGAGKTTSSAKLAAYLKKQGRAPLLIASDLARPAGLHFRCAKSRNGRSSSPASAKSSTNSSCSFPIGWRAGFSGWATSLASSKKRRKPWMKRKPRGWSANCGARPSTSTISWPSSK